MSKPKRTNYWDYIRVRELMSLQGGLEHDEEQISHDEVIFITVHQVFEMWFKLMLRDLIAARNLFAQDHVPDDAMADACRFIDRVRTALGLCAEHFKLMETMTPRDYLEFRDKLFPANGGQSAQFREVEIVLGLEDSQRIPFLAEESYREVLKEEDGSAGWALRKVQERIADTPTFKDAVERWLSRTPINGSSLGDEGDEEVVDSFVNEYLQAHGANIDSLTELALKHVHTPEEKQGMRERYGKEKTMAARFLRSEEIEDPQERRLRKRVRAAILFIESYRELPLLAWPRAVVDGLVAMEQTFVVFRQRHARMAERMIGRRVGTGGSAGVRYLDEVALRYRVFEDLWAVRTLLIRRDRTPDPKNTELYRFRFEQI